MSKSSKSMESRKSESSCTKCKCGECSERNDINDHLTNVYSQLNAQNRLIQEQSQTLTLIFKEVIPLLKSVSEKTQQSNSLLRKLEL